MLTPPLSEDCPEGTRLSGYRLEIQPGDQLNQVLYKVAGPKFPAIRAYGYDIGRVNFQQKMFDLPRRLSLQMFDADLCTEVAQKLQSFHCKTPEVDHHYVTLFIRLIDPWEWWDSLNASIAQLIGRVQSLEKEMHYLKQQLEAIGLSGAGAAGAAGAATKFLPPGPDRDP